LRRAELILLISFALAAIVAGWIGTQGAPAGDDPRLSTELSGPRGARALALALEDLGTPVERRRRALFDLATGEAVDTTVTLALLDLTTLPSGSELLALRRWVDAGGLIFTAGFNGIENCFGVAVGREGHDSISLILPPALDAIPGTDERLVLTADSTAERPSPTRLPLFPDVGEEPRDTTTREAGADTAAAGADSAPAGEPEAEQREDEEAYGSSFHELETPEGCRRQPEAIDTLLMRVDSIPVALHLRFDGGGRVTILSDSKYLSNRVLRDTDAGALVIPWLLEGGPRRVIFDEYHHGFGTNRSLFLAAGSWLLERPGGWAILQLFLAALIAVAAAAVRFGPALDVIERRRRSPLEHLEALAMGLERARGRSDAINLMIEGLRRRLSRGPLRRDESGGRLIAWLDTMDPVVATTEARAARQRLARLAREPYSDDAVLEAARTVEKLWKELGR
jgi:hypothetical protein